MRIVRVWRGATSTAKADGYVQVVERTGVKALRETPGNRGVWVLRRVLGDKTEFRVVSLWDSLEVIHGFAGADIEKAVFYPEDDDYLVERDLTVSHFELASGSAAPAAAP